jgi:hypothetical protein
VRYLTFKRVSIANSGLILILLSDGSIAIERPASSLSLCDSNLEGVTGIFDAAGFTLIEGEDKQDYDYGCTYPYKTMPVLKKWLEQQQLLWSEETF